jgi:hypothetical protein
MRQLRLRLRSLIWQTRMRFQTGDCPAARSIFPQVTHLPAASRGFRHGAAAVAPANDRLAHSRRSIRPGGECQETRGEAQVKDYPRSDSAETPERKEPHGEIFSRDKKKTDSPGLPNEVGTCVLMVLDCLP